MQQIEIKGNLFDEEEVLAAGRKRVRTTKNFFRWFGAGLFGLGMIFLLATLISYSEDMLVYGILTALPGLVFFVMSFLIRPNVLESGKKAIAKQLESPLGNNGLVVEILSGDKVLELSSKPVSRLCIDSSKKQFQLFINKSYTKIYDVNDLVDYEIRVDNEVIVTSKTKSKKGIGKAIVGGALFGGVGAVAGAVAGNSKGKTTSSQKEIHHYSLVLKVNDFQKPSFIVSLDSEEIAEEVVTIFDLLVGNAAVKQDSKRSSVPTDSSLDSFEQMKKYKELLDAGIISQQEYDAKKKELLKL